MGKIATIQLHGSAIGLTIHQTLLSSTPYRDIKSGENDALAMANAAVGIATGAASLDVALETADVALTSHDLHYLPFAEGLSRASNRIIRQIL